MCLLVPISKHSRHAFQIKMLLQLCHLGHHHVHIPPKNKTELGKILDAFLIIINSNNCPHQAISDNHLSRSHPVICCLPKLVNFLGAEEIMLSCQTLNADHIIQFVLHGLSLRMAAVATHK